MCIRDRDVRDLTQHELRDKLGYVPQKGVLFSGNIASNIMFGNPAGSEQEMTAVSYTHLDVYKRQALSWLCAIR